MEVIKTANVALRFLLELCILVALGYWGVQTGQGLLAKIGLGIGVPLVAAVVWGLVEASSSPWQLHDPWHLVCSSQVSLQACCSTDLKRLVFGTDVPYSQHKGLEANICQVALLHDHI